MKNIQREDILIISRHSDLSEKGMDKALTEVVYNNQQSWQKFLRLLLLVSGIGFTLAGIIFFFAYNWEDIDKFAKLAFVEALIIATTGLLLWSKINSFLKNILLTGSCILVGVLFAVFGQIYQTGANAYDFFFSWTLFVTLWVIVSNFPPLWLIYILLIHTTLILYMQQVATYWTMSFLSTLLFSINAIVAICANLIIRYRKEISIPIWFIYTLTLFAIISATVGNMAYIFEDKHSFSLLPILTIFIYALGILYGWKSKNSFYLALIPFSIILIISALIITNVESMDIFLVTLFVLGSITLLVTQLINIQKKWKNEA